jgi:hypothetical protein
MGSILLGALACSTTPSTRAPDATTPVSRESSNARTAQLEKLVKVTSNPKDVAGCRVVGKVGGGGPAITVTRPEGDWLFDPPRNDTHLLGGNTLLTSDGSHGTAYLCPTGDRQ